jgi:hypothetical protein
MSQTRNTDRKRFIQAILAETAGTPMALEELRWQVMRKELAHEQQPVPMMTQSYQKSFNRSLRSFLPSIAPEMRIHRIWSSQGWTAGLLARIAVHRMENAMQLDRFLACPSPSLHFWSNARTRDIWQEGYDGEVEVHDEELLPSDAPHQLEPLYQWGSRWPHSTPERDRGLEQLGPKWIKHPIVCAKICTRAIAVPEQADILAVIRIPTNLPLLVIGHPALSANHLQKLARTP